MNRRTRNIDMLVAEARRRAPLDAVEVMEGETDSTVAEVLKHLHPALAFPILLRFPKERRDAILPLAGEKLARPWAENRQYPDNSVGRLMEPVVAVFPPDLIVEDAVQQIRELVRQTVVTYGYVTDADGKLLGVLTMRDLLLADVHQPLHEIMLDEPFFLSPQTSVSDAMKEVVYRHYPVYPVCDEQGRLIGIVHGFMLFEQQSFEISSQAGRMVGVDKEEHATTPWLRSFLFRHPWLQLNLLTAFAAAVVVSLFEDTIAQVVVLAAFLPVLAGQSGNTGCQALAVTIRGLTLGEFERDVYRQVLAKETWLGLLNGILVGIVAAIAMILYANHSNAEQPLVLGLVVFLAMTGACVASGVTGVLVPLTLRRIGADPATASSIFLTTATDIVSMGLFLWLASLFVL